MFIYSNLATSLDGKIATVSRIQYLLGTPEDRRQMQVLRGRADAILIGASTLRAFQGPLVVSARKTGRQPLNVILSSALEGVSPKFPFFTDTRIHRLIFLNRELPKPKLKQFEKLAEFVVLKKPSPQLSHLKQVTRELEKRGIKNLLVEGGGGVMWDFVHSGLIDEFHVTLTPKIIGGREAPTLVDGLGFKPEQVLDLKLTECRVVKDEIYLTYRRKRS